MSTFQYSLNAHKRSLKRLKAKEVKRKVQWKTFEEERDERKRDDLQLNSCAFQGERMSLPRGERKWFGIFNWESTLNLWDILLGKNTWIFGIFCWERILEPLGYFTGKEYLNLWDISLGKNAWISTGDGKLRNEYLNMTFRWNEVIHKLLLLLRIRIIK